MSIDTPRTDKAACLMCHVAGVDVNFARDLERDLTRAHEDKRALRDALEEIINLTRQPYNFTNRIQLAAKKALVRDRQPRSREEHGGGEMSQEFMRRYAKSYPCPWCRRAFSIKGIKQHKRCCKSLRKPANKPQGAATEGGP